FAYWYGFNLLFDSCLFALAKIQTNYYRTNFFLRKYEKHTEGMPRGRGLAAPESVCLLSISFR
ncbi:MAG: hypothetical protein J5965_06685, partial [Aeriscardovia sp.]|nr:hypothetical protein [Aeriscardovia sp.]